MRKPHVAVIGAGAFGGWTALYLLRGGARVTLIDAWGPGNSRASSGGETRVMRGTYGPDQPYTALAARSLSLWTANERKWKRQFLHRIGVLWMAAGHDDAWEAASLAMLKESKIPYSRFSRRELTKRWPQINFEGIDWGVFEPQSGYLLARASCQAVVEGFIAEGGIYRQAAVDGDLDSGEHEDSLRSLTARNFAPTVSYLPAVRGWENCFRKQSEPIFKRQSRMSSSSGRLPGIGDSTRISCRYGRTIASHSCTEFPAIKAGASRLRTTHAGQHSIPPMVSGESTTVACSGRASTYACAFPRSSMLRWWKPAFASTSRRRTATSSSIAILQHQHVWLVGGGSGHGFKHGPALGELVAKLVLKDAETNPRWALARFSRKT